MFSTSGVPDIATANGGNRASGFQGYGASVQYVMDSCRGGLHADHAGVRLRRFSEPRTRVSTRTARRADLRANTEYATMSYSDSGDVTGAADHVDERRPAARRRADEPGLRGGGLRRLHRAGGADPARRAARSRRRSLNAQNAPGRRRRSWSSTTTRPGALNRHARRGLAGRPAAPTTSRSRSSARSLRASARRWSPRTPSGDDRPAPRRVDAENDPRQSFNVLDRHARPASRRRRSWSAPTSTPSTRGRASTTTARAAAFNLELAAADGQAEHQAGQQDPLRLLGRGGVGPGRRDAVCRRDLRRGVRARSG